MQANDKKQEWFLVYLWHKLKHSKMKKLFLSVLVIAGLFTATAQTKKKTTTKAKSKVATIAAKAATAAKAVAVSDTDIATALKEALNKGVEKEVTKLMAEDGFYKNEAVKILLPDELQKVDKKLRQLGMASLADEGLKLLNRAAEKAVGEATPIFVSAITNITFTDAKNILMGADNSATTYLQGTTNKPLYDKFSPVIKTSLDEVGATAAWEKIINKYNGLPLVTKVNPDLTDYTTTKALDGVYKMIAVEEKDIRTNVKSRTSDLLKNVFAMQDKK
jgi:guanyl-specific ribonuclease Sa